MSISNLYSEVMSIRERAQKNAEHAKMEAENEQKQRLIRKFVSDFSYIQDHLAEDNISVTAYIDEMGYTGLTFERGDKSHNVPFKSNGEWMPSSLHAFGNWGDDYLIEELYKHLCST